MKTARKTAARDPFVHLHVHSNYTLLSGADKVGEIAAAAKLMGMDSVALTDTNAMYGVVPFYQAAGEAGIKPIIGAEIDVEGTSAVLLARDGRGYPALCEIVTRRQLDDDFPMEHNPNVHGRRKAARPGAEDNENAVSEANSNNNDNGGNHGSLILRRESAGSGVSENKTNGPTLDVADKDRAVEKIRGWLQNCGRGLFVITHDGKLIEELARTPLRNSLYVELCDFGGYESRKRVEKLCALAEKLRLPCVATNNVHFVTVEGHFRHRLLTAIRLNTTLENLPCEKTVSPQCRMKPGPEMMRIFKDIPEAVMNARRIADMCNLDIKLGNTHLPKFAVPRRETAESYLRRVCMKGAKKRYGMITEEVRKRIDYELSVIEKLGYAAYFLVVWDIARFAWHNGIPSVGRGSAANSIVSYCLGLTHVCPLKYNLFFERFLNLERKDCPDVDLDFCWKRRDKVLEYVYDKYGRDRVAMICTFNTFGMRSSIREVAKVHGLLNDEISAFTKRLPYFEFGSIEKIAREVPECRDLPVDKEPWKTILRHAAEIANYPRHLGVHPGGIVISPARVTKFLPLQYTAKGIVITQYDMDPVEDMGLVKIDLLGQRSLSVIADVVELLAKRDRIRLQMTSIDEGDEKTVEMWQSAGTIGCFQIESPSMRGLLKKLRVDNIGILTAASSIVRPGPSDGGMTKQFIDRYNGKEEVTYLHPKLEKILGETYGVMIYQEDVIKVVHELAGIGFGEAEMLRKSMSKKRGIEAVASYEKRFIDGAMKRGISRKVAEKIWEKIASFAGYSFCKAHSASYAQLSYQATFLKAHFPAEFMAAVVANGGGFYNAAVYINEARRLGLRILPPDVNESEPDCAGCDGKIRTGLLSIRDLTQKSIDRILEYRKKTPFDSLQDFCMRTEAGRGEVENLVKCGAFDCFGKTRPQLLWEVEMMFGNGRSEERRSAKAGSKKKLSLLCETPDLFYGYRFIASGGAPTDLRDYDIGQKVLDEMRVLGFAVSAHPVAQYQHRMDKLGVVPNRDVPRYAGKRVKVAGTVVATRRVRTVKGGHMRFVTLEDMTGTVETVLFPKAYDRWGAAINSLGPYLVTGTVESDYGHCTITVDTLKPLTDNSKRSLIERRSMGHTPSSLAFNKSPAIHHGL